MKVQNEEKSGSEESEKQPTGGLLSEKRPALSVPYHGTVETEFPRREQFLSVESWKARRATARGKTTRVGVVSDAGVGGALSKAEDYVMFFCAYCSCYDAKQGFSQRYGRDRCGQKIGEGIHLIFKRLISFWVQLDD